MKNKILEEIIANIVVGIIKLFRFIFGLLFKSIWSFIKIIIFIFLAIMALYYFGCIPKAI